MNIRKLFSIRVYEHTKSFRSALRNFLEDIRQHADWQIRISWDEKEIFERLTGGTLIMLMLGEEICGIANYHVQPPTLRKNSDNPHRKDTAWISDFVIHPRYRKIGLGKMLLDTIENYSRYLSKKQLRMNITVHSKHLEVFMKINGFRVEKQLFRANSNSLGKALYPVRPGLIKSPEQSLAQLPD